MACDTRARQLPHHVLPPAGDLTRRACVSLTKTGLGVAHDKLCWTYTGRWPSIAKCLNQATGDSPSFDKERFKLGRWRHTSASTDRSPASAVCPARRGVMSEIGASCMSQQTHDRRQTTWNRRARQSLHRQPQMSTSGAAWCARRRMESAEHDTNVRWTTSYPFGRHPLEFQSLQTHPAVRHRRSFSLPPPSPSFTMHPGGARRAASDGRRAWGNSLRHAD